MWQTTNSWIMLVIFCLLSFAGLLSAQDLPVQEIKKRINYQRPQSPQKVQDVLNNAQQQGSKIAQYPKKWKDKADSLRNLFFNKTLKDSLKWKNFYFGGDFGLALNVKQVFINISPMMGYKLTDKFSIGGGLVCQYLRTQLIMIDPFEMTIIKQSAQTFIYGSRAFARLSLFKKVFAQADAEMLSVQFPTTDGSKYRIWAPGLRAGAGYTINLWDRAAINLIASYNFLFQEGRSPYGGPVDVRVGIQF